MRKAFSLVELSIVLVILGLLVGGILAGQSLIRASELRAITSEFNRYQTATMAFRDKYFAVPGDMTNAVSFWGQSTACAGAVATGSCNGNGDGMITATSAGASGEAYQFWRQLALAGLVEGTYSGTAGASGPWESLIGTNVPASKLSGAGWSVFNTGTMGAYAGDANTYALAVGNFFMVGLPRSTVLTNNAVLKPEEAWNIDTKMDDGTPGSGKVTPFSYPNGWYVSASNTNTCTTSTSFSNMPGAYNLSVTSAQCAMYFIRAF